MNIVVDRIDSELGSWTHGEWRPPPGHPLSPVVERIWDFEGRTTQRRERVFPNGSVELIVRLDDRDLDVHDGMVELTSPTRVTGYDQPHMNAEFRELAGLTPGEFLATPRYPASTSTTES